jgi:hypothetical protein
MTLFDLIKLNLGRYRENPVIAVPPVTVVIAYMLTSRLTPLSRVIDDVGTNYFMGFGILFLNLAVPLLCLLGQVSMAGKIVGGGKADLDDWVEGIRAYFSRVLGVSLIYLGTFMIFVILLMGAYFTSFILPLASQIGLITDESVTLALSSPQSIAIVLGFALINASATAFLYMWTASIVFDDQSVFDSLRLGSRASKEGRKKFLGLIAIMFVASGITALINYIPLYLGLSTELMINQGYYTPLTLVSQAIDAVFSPLWMLIAFTIYHRSPLHLVEAHI